MPCQELLINKLLIFKKEILDQDSLIVTIEAGNVSVMEKIF